MAGPVAGPAVGPNFGGLNKGDGERRRLAEEVEKLMRLKSSFPRRISDFLQMERKQIIRETGSRIMADELSTSPWYFR